MASIAKEGGPVRRSGWIPWAFVGAFVVVIGANAALIIESSRSWTGVVSETPFDTGNDYNRIMAQTEREAAAGWRVSAQAARLGDTLVRISVDVGADAATPVLSVDATLLRPIGIFAPIPIALKPVSPGHFEAEVKLPESGNWDLHLTIRGDADRQLHTTRRLFVS